MKYLFSQIRFAILTLKLRFYYCVLYRLANCICYIISFQIWPEKRFDSMPVFTCLHRISMRIFSRLPMFMALKGLTGLFGSPSYSCMTTYTAEIVSEKKRTIGTMIIWAVYPVGNLLLSLTSYFTQNWKQTLFYSTMPYMFIVVILL